MSIYSSRVDEGFGASALSAVSRQAGNAKVLGSAAKTMGKSVLSKVGDKSVRDVASKAGKHVFKHRGKYSAGAAAATTAAVMRKKNKNEAFLSDEDRTYLEETLFNHFF